MPQESSPLPEDLFHQALELNDAGQSAASEKLLRDLISLYPAFEDAYEALAVMLYNVKRYDDAISLLGEWIRINPDALMARTNLSRCFAAKGMIAEAEEAQAEARRLTWKAELAEGKKNLPPVDHAGQIARFKEIIKLDPEDVLGHFSLATAYMNAGMKREALDAFEQAVRVDPGHSSSWLGLGNVLEALGDRRRAVETYRQGILAADRKGDMVPLRKMEARLRALEANPG